jgi:hypothetical protein
LAAGFLGVLLGVVQIVGLAQSSNSEIGTWQLNVAKSTFSGGVPLKSGTTKIEAAGAGIKTTVDVVRDDGTVAHNEFMTNDDGKDNPIVGNSAQGDMIARTRINATTVKMVNKKDGTVTTIQTSVISEDGKTRTLTTTGTNASGRTVNNVLVWNKQ